MCEFFFVYHSIFCMVQFYLLPSSPSPGLPPGICNFFLTWQSNPHPRAHRKRRFPTPGTPHRPQILVLCTKPKWRYWFPYSSKIRRFDKNLRRFPLNVRAVSAKIKLPKKYLQHCHILRTDKKNLSWLLLPSWPREREVIHISIKKTLHVSSKQNGARF